MIFKSFDEAIDGISYLANLAQKICSDKETFSLTGEMFEETYAAPILSIGKIPPAVIMQLSIADGCLRHVQAAILADDKVEKTELADSWEIVRPLAEYYGKNLKNYDQFAEMSPDKLVKFLAFQQKDDGLFGGEIKTIAVDADNFDHMVIDIVDIEKEFPGGCLVACLAALCSKRGIFEVYNNIINYVMLRILSDDKRLQTRGIEKSIEIVQYLWSNLLRHRLADYYFAQVEDKFADPRLIKVRQQLALEFED